jgi:hypothetical protein
MNRQTQIEQLAGDGELEELKKLLEPTNSQPELDVALTNAIAYSRLGVAKCLLELGANIESLNYEGVYYAVHNNELEGLKFSVDQGVDVNILKGSLINTSIETAMNTGDCEILKWLLANGANPKLISRNSKRIAKRHGTLELQQIVKDATESRNLKIVGAYALGITCLVLFFMMKNSTALNEFLDKAERTRADWKFGTFAIIGLIQYGLLTAGISIIGILTILLIRRKIAT